MITALEIKIEIATAIKRFGEYSFYDKGPGEVMDLGRIYERMMDMNAQQIADVLADVRTYAAAGKPGEGETFVQHMLCDLDDRPELDALYADPRLEGLY